MAALVRHLHAFAREVNLTEEEFDLGIDFLNRIGQATNDTHNEGILFSDVLGLLDAGLPAQQRRGRRDGDRFGAARPVLADELAAHRKRRLDRPLRKRRAGAVRQRPRSSIRRAGGSNGVEVDVWQASPVGLYENQDDTQADMNLRGKFTTDAEGRFGFRSIRPAGYPVPTARPRRRPAARPGPAPVPPGAPAFPRLPPGYKTLITQVFVDDDEHLETDVVFGVTRHLIGDFRKKVDARPDSGLVHAGLHLRHGTGRSKTADAADQVKHTLFKRIHDGGSGFTLRHWQHAVTGRRRERPRLAAFWSPASESVLHRPHMTQHREAQPMRRTFLLAAALILAGTSALRRRPISPAARSR